MAVWRVPFNAGSVPFNVGSVPFNVVRAPCERSTLLSDAPSCQSAEPPQLCRFQGHVDLLGFEVLFEPERAEFAAPAALFVTAPRGFIEGGVVVIQPGDPCAHA